MNSRILTIDSTHWQLDHVQDEWITALESGQVLYFPQLSFNLLDDETKLLTPEVRDPKKRNISLDEHGQLKGAQGDAQTLSDLSTMVQRFRNQAQSLVASLTPNYVEHLRLAPTSYRPSQVQTRSQSWRADDRRLHVDAFPSRPNYGERILRVFANVNPNNEPRVWRIGDDFESIAKQFLPRAKPYSRLQALALNALFVTKKFRSEYDHLMLQLHDGMKADLEYQKNADQITMPFASGSVWVCFSDQASHAVMSGQYMLEQTFHLPVEQQYHPELSPLHILQRLTGKGLI